MAVGGCTGSTSGGIKIFRFAVLHAVASNQFARLIRPHGVFVSTFNRRPLPEAAAISVMAFIFLFGAVVLDRRHRPLGARPRLS